MYRVNKELGKESTPSSSSEEYLAYGNERIDYQLYNELDYTDPDNAGINHDMEEDSLLLLHCICIYLMYFE